MIRDPRCQSNHGGDPAPGPELAPETLGFGAAVQPCRQAGERLDREPATGPRWGAMAQGLQTSLVGTPHPWADGRFADPRGLDDLALGPALVLEVPSLQPSGFFPVR
jgi:hypothetical protein